MTTRLLTLRDVTAMTALSRSTVYALAESRCPKPIRLGSRPIRRVEQEVLDFIASRPRRGSGTARRVAGTCGDLLGRRTGSAAPSTSRCKTGGRTAPPRDLQAGRPVHRPAFGPPSDSRTVNGSTGWTS